MVNGKDRGAECYLNLINDCLLFSVVVVTVVVVVVIVVVVAGFAVVGIFLLLLDLAVNLIHVPST